MSIALTKLDKEIAQAKIVEANTSFDDSDDEDEDEDEDEDSNSSFDEDESDEEDEDSNSSFDEDDSDDEDYIENKIFALITSKKRRSSVSSARSMNSGKKPRKVCSTKGVFENKKSEIFVMNPRKHSGIKPPIKENGQVAVSTLLDLNVHFDKNTASRRRNNCHWPIEAGIREVMGRLYSFTSHYHVCITFNTIIPAFFHI